MNARSKIMNFFHRFSNLGDFFWNFFFVVSGLTSPTLDLLPHFLTNRWFSKSQFTKKNIFKMTESHIMTCASHIMTFFLTDFHRFSNLEDFFRNVFFCCFGADPAHTRPSPTLSDQPVVFKITIHKKSHFQNDWKSYYDWKSFWKWLIFTDFQISRN